MKKKLAVQMGFFMFLSWNLISAQDHLKIGHVNIAEIVKAMPENDSAQTSLDNDQKEFRSMLEDMQVEYNKKLADYQENIDSYSQVIRKSKETELVELQNRIQEFQQNATQQLQQRNLELMQPIYNKIQAAINKVATDLEFTYILDISNGTVVFTSDDSQNINSLVLNELGIKQ